MPFIKKLKKFSHFFFLFCFFFLGLNSPSWADSTLANSSFSKNLYPVTYHCLSLCAQRFNLPKSLLLSIMETEGGLVGRVNYNKNGSFDIGPMQINSWWLKILAPMEISMENLRDNGCLNLWAASFILKDSFLKRGNFIQTIKDYHSQNPELAHKYFLNLKKRAKNLKVEKTLNRANFLIFH